MLEQLSTQPPGPEMAALLDRIDRSTLDGGGLLTVIQAQWRLIAHLHASLLADMAAVGRIAAGPDCPPEQAKGPLNIDDITDAPYPVRCSEYGTDEIGPALRLSRGSAQCWMDLAIDTTNTERFPGLHDALRDGAVDAPKVRVFCAEIDSAVEDTLAAKIVGKVLPAAAKLTCGQIRSRIRKLPATHDTAAAKRRYEAGIAGRRVECHRDVDGTATIYGWQLPADRAAAAVERVDAFAKSAKCGGDERSMDQLRADAFLDLLDGHLPGAAPVYRRGIVELTIPAATLAGLSDEPGEIAGFGPVTAEVSRQVAQTEATEKVWQYTVLDAEGHVRHHGTLRRRPTQSMASAVRARTRHCVFPAAASRQSDATSTTGSATRTADPPRWTTSSRCVGTTTGPRTRAVGRRKRWTITRPSGPARSDAATP